MPGRLGPFRGPVIGVALVVAGLGIPAVTGMPGHSSGPVAQKPVNDAAKAAAMESFAHAPLTFEPNVGQAGPHVSMVARGLGHTLSLAPTEAILAVGESAVGMRMLGASPSATVAGRHELEGRVNYYVGNDPTRWRSDVPTYGQAANQGVWPGIDLVWRSSSDKALEYDFVVAPGADPKNIAVAFDGAKAIRLDGDELVVESEGAELRQPAPVVYQDRAGKRALVPGRFVLDGSTVRFTVGAYDASLPLVIDPVLAWSTYLGGSIAPFGDEYGREIAVDDLGSAYVTGQTCTASFPDTQYAYQKTLKGGCDAFVTKFIPTVNTGVGTGLKYSTFLGGSGSDEGLQIALDAARNAYVAGGTGSADFPTTVGAYQRTGGGTFVAKLNKKGLSLLYSTRLNGDGGGGMALGPALPATPTQPTVYVMGESTGPTTTPDAFQASCHLNGLGGCGDEWVAKLNPVAGGASDLLYASYLGGAENQEYPAYPEGDLAVDGAGRVYITVGRAYSNDLPITGANGSFDSDTGNMPGCPSPPLAGYVAELDPSLPSDGTGLPSATNQQLVWSTYLQAAYIQGIALGPGDTVYLTGSNGDQVGCNGVFPTTAGAFDTTYACPGLYCKAFVAKFDPALPGDGSGVVSATNQQLVYSTYIAEEATGYDIVVDAAGRAWVSGLTYSAYAPRKDPVQSTCGCFFHSARADGYVFSIDPGGNGADDLVFGTFLGGKVTDWLEGIALDAAGSVYVTGTTNSYKNSDGNAKADRYPVTPNAFQLNAPGAANNGTFDAVVSKIGGF